MLRPVLLAFARNILWFEFLQVVNEKLNGFADIMAPNTGIPRTWGHITHSVEMLFSVILPFRTTVINTKLYLTKKFLR